MLYHPHYAYNESMPASPPATAAVSALRTSTAAKGKKKSKGKAKGKAAGKNKGSKKAPKNASAHTGDAAYKYGRMDYSGGYSSGNFNDLSLSGPHLQAKKVTVAASASLLAPSSASKGKGKASKTKTKAVKSKTKPKSTKTKAKSKVSKKKTAKNAKSAAGSSSKSGGNHISHNQNTGISNALGMGAQNSGIVFKTHNMHAHMTTGVSGINGMNLYAAHPASAYNYNNAYGNYAAYTGNKGTAVSLNNNASCNNNNNAARTANSTSMVNGLHAYNFSTLRPQPARGSLISPNQHNAINATQQHYPANHNASVPSTQSPHYSGNSPPGHPNAADRQRFGYL